MLDSGTVRKLTALFETMLEFYREFFALEEEKLDTLKSSRLELLDSLLRREQASVLRAKGLELDRQRLMEEVGNSGKTFRELLELFPPEDREKPKELYEELSSTIVRLQKVIADSAHLLRIKSMRAAAIVSRLDNDPQLRQVYGEKLNRAKPDRSIFSKKI
jgi:hypothetical protein